MGKIHLNDKEKSIVKFILEKHIPKHDVVVFGSRADGIIKPYSDLDLCIMGDDSPSPSVLDDLKEAFSQSDLPMRVDIVVWSQTQAHFQDIIQKQSLEFFKNVK
jgi:predicted nucleotidyltransferase